MKFNVSHNLIVLGLLVGLLTGCESMQVAEDDAAWPRGLPDHAVLIGGGIFQELTLPASGLLYIVDADTNTVVLTQNVEAGKPIEIESEMLVGSVLIARVGYARARQIMGDGEAAAGDEAGFGAELYFLPLDRLNVEQSWDDDGDHDRDER